MNVNWGFRPKLQSSDWFRRSLRTTKQNGNFRSSALFYDYYNIYNIVTVYNLQQLMSSCLPVNTSSET